MPQLRRLLTEARLEKNWLQVKRPSTPLLQPPIIIRNLPIRSPMKFVLWYSNPRHEFSGLPVRLRIDHRWQLSRMTFFSKGSPGKV